MKTSKNILDAVIGTIKRFSKQPCDFLDEGFIECNTHRDYVTKFSFTYGDLRIYHDVKNKDGGGYLINSFIWNGKNKQIISGFFLDEKLEIVRIESNHINQTIELYNIVENTYNVQINFPDGNMSKSYYITDNDNKILLYQTKTNYDILERTITVNGKMITVPLAEEIYHTYDVQSGVLLIRTDRYDVIQQKII